MRIVFILSVILFGSCASLKSPVGSKEVYGCLLSCIGDSTAMFSTEKIIIKPFSNKEINSQCRNQDSVAYDDSPWWPAWIYFNFKKRDFFFISNGRVRQSTGKMAWDDYDGFFEYNKKAKMLTLVIPEFNWQSTFKESFDGQYLKLTRIDTIVKVKLRYRPKNRDEAIMKTLNKYTE
jgi:hypothetical protein